MLPRLAFGNLLDRRFRIRAAVADDAPVIARLLRAQEKAHKGSLGGVHYPSLRESVRKGWVHVGLFGDEIVGSVEYYRRQDGWQTVYQLAVDPRYEGLGIGRNLLYSVDCPVRLKCPVTVNGGDANPANTFYANAGMRLAATDTTRTGKALNVWELPILPILVQGTNRRMPEVARRSGWAYGTRNAEIPRDWCYQLDIEWRNYVWTEYLDLVRQIRPFAALVPDYEHRSQRRTMLNRIEHLKALGVMRVLVCPKFDGAVADIPADCVVAVSIPSSYAGFVPHYHELNGRRVHLLGGSPPKWFGARSKQQSATGYIAGMVGAGAQVISVDGNAHTGAAEGGILWHDHRWIKPDEPVDLYGFSVRSGRAILADLHAVSTRQQLSLFAA